MAQNTQAAHDPFFLNNHLDMSSVPPEDNTNDKSSRSVSPPQAPSEPASVALERNSRTASVSHTPPPTIPSVDAAMSIQAILSAAKREGANGPGPGQPWASHTSGDHPAPLPGSIGQVSSNKRKLEDSESDDPHSKIRRIVRDHILPDPSRVLPMTTVICLHAAVAQKSYGSEKRFLCPPPVVHIEGPLWHMRTQQLAMAVVSESAERSFVQKSSLDNNMTASFKFLHVTGSAKAKSFQLSLDIAEPPPPALTPDGTEPPPGRVWASFDSAPVTIISKPSKKTAKTRNISSCILAGGPVSLFNRINSQTVRTKYMTIDHAQLCASNVAWSAFNVNVVRKPGGPGAAPPVGVNGPQPVTYGCEIILSDTHSGITTAPLIIRKVDKGKVTLDEGGPVSQMQKIALQRVNPDGSRHYLSAAGPIPGTPGVIAPPAPGMSTQAGTHPLLFQSPRIREEIKDGYRVVCDEVDDYLCWTIVGISKFQYTFFDAGQNNAIPEQPITPFPTLFTSPLYRPSNNHIELTVSNFFYEHPTTKQQTPLDVYLGNIGPLNLRVYQTTPPGPLTTVNPYIGGSPSGGQVMGAPTAAPIAPDPSARFMPSQLHTIVIVDMPSVPEIMKALEDNALPSPINSMDSKSHSQEGSSTEVRHQPPPPPPLPSIAARSLPLLFIRSYDGIGYHSGRTITCENVFQGMDLGGLAAGQPNGAVPNIETNWLAAQATAAAGGSLHGWTLRVL